MTDEVVEYYENKEKQLRRWIRRKMESSEQNTSDNYSVNLAWNYYRKALKDVLKQMEVMERVKND